jgi:hypothetical protein
MAAQWSGAVREPEGEVVHAAWRAPARLHRNRRFRFAIYNESLIALDMPLTPKTMTEAEESGSESYVSTHPHPILWEGVTTQSLFLPHSLRNVSVARALSLRDQSSFEKR